MKNKIILPFVVFAGIYVILVSMFWFTMIHEDAAAYSLLVLWTSLPVSIFLSAFFMGRFSGGRWHDFPAKYLFIILYGLMYMGSEYFTYCFANMMTFHHILMPDFSMMAVGCVLSAVGIAIGCATNKPYKE